MGPLDLNVMETSVAESILYGGNYRRTTLSSSLTLLTVHIILPTVFNEVDWRVYNPFIGGNKQHSAGNYIRIGASFMQPRHNHAR